MPKNTSKYPNFSNALRQLAKTNRERAEVLGVSERSVVNYLYGVRLPPVEIVKQFPALDEALTRDIRPSKPHQNTQLPA